MIGNAEAEQTRLQSIVENEAAVKKAERRERRKRHRAGLMGLLVHVATAA